MSPISKVLSPLETLTFAVRVQPGPRTGSDTMIGSRSIRLSHSDELPKIPRPPCHPLRSLVNSGEEMKKWTGSLPFAFACLPR